MGHHLEKQARNPIVFLGMQRFYRAVSHAKGFTHFFCKEPKKCNDHGKKEVQYIANFLGLLRQPAETDLSWQIKMKAGPKK